MIFGPPSPSHRFEDKFAKMDEVLCVGRSDDFDPSQDFMDELNDPNLLVRGAG